MQLTKFTHACLRLEKDGVVLVVDPGNFSESEALDGADAVIITHGHADHLDVDKITKAYATNPDLVVLAPADAAEQLAPLGSAVTVVAAGERHEVAGFHLATYGGEHATIVEGYPVPQNVGYLIDGSLYYPGDSFFVPQGVEVRTLMAPASAPWMKIAETIAFVRAIQPQRVHPTHDAILSDAGRGMVDSWFERAGGSDYARLPIGQPVDLD
jgi:L-ascorbate metabolism protein UlaG (beta-lactamase superfamily)